MAGSFSRSSRITGRIPGLVPGRESALTRSGQPVEKKMTETPEPEDKLDATTTVVVNGPEDASFDWQPLIGGGSRMTYVGCGSGSSRRRGRGTSRGSAACRS